MLAGLGHRAVGGGDDQDRAVHLGGAGDHVLDVVGVARAVDVGVVALVGLVLDVGDRDRDPALALLGSVVDRVEGAVLGLALEGEVLGDRRGQARSCRGRCGRSCRCSRAAWCARTSSWPSLSAPGSCPSGRLDLRLLDEFRRQAGRDLGVVTEFHRRRRAALAHRAQVRDVAEHLGERDERPDDLGRSRATPSPRSGRAGCSGRRSRRP